MRLPTLFLLLSCLTVYAAPYGETTRAAFGKLKEALLAEANIAVPGEGTAERRLHDAQMHIRELEQTLEQGTEALSPFEHMSVRIQSGYKSPAVREAWGVLLKTAREESQQTRQSLDDQVAALTSRLKTLVGTSTSPEDFDDIIQQLDPAGFGGRNEGGMLYRKVESARAFAVNWQEYLSAKAAGDQNRLSQSLSQLLSSSANSGPFISRSKLLQEQTFALESGIPSSRIADVLSQVKTPEDLPAAISELSRLVAASRNSGSGGENMGYAITALTNMQRLHAETGAGLGLRLELINPQLAQQGSFVAGEAAVIRIRALVLRAHLPSFIAQTSTGEIRAEESIEDYTKRALKNALAEGDLDALVRLSSLSAGARSGMAEYGMTYLDSTLRLTTGQSLTSCFAARNFEAAGEPLSAVMSWHAALKSGSTYTPAEYIGRRLEAIKRDHPEAYAQAMEKVLVPAPVAVPFLGFGR